MPTYVYKFVETGETIEVQQAFTDDSLTETTHPQTGEVMAVKKVFQPIGVTFKGGGFYKTDSRPGSSKSASTTSSTDSGSGSGDSTSSESSSTTPSKESSTPAKNSTSSTPAAASTTKSTPASD